MRVQDATGGVENSADFESIDSKPMDCRASLAMTIGKHLHLAQNEIQSFPEGEKPGFLIDLNDWIRFQLIEAGLKSENIEVCKINTFEDQRFHSQRRARIMDRSDSFGVGLGFIAQI